MSIEHIGEELVKKASQEVLAINSSFKLQEKELKDSYSLEFERFSKQVTQDYSKDIAQKTSSILSSAKTQANSLVLQARSDVLEQMKVSFLEKLTSLSSSQKRDFYAPVIAYVEKNFSNLQKVICSKEDKSVLSSLFSSKPKFELDENIKGFVCEFEDSTSLNLTYDELSRLVFREQGEDILDEVLS